jgi:hypothetical protein
MTMIADVVDRKKAQMDDRTYLYIMRLSIADLQRMAYGDACVAGEGCGSMGYVRFDLPIEHPGFGRVFFCSCAARDS